MHFPGLAQSHHIVLPVGGSATVAEPPPCYCTHLCPHLGVAVPCLTTQIVYTRLYTPGNFPLAMTCTWKAQATV